MTLRPVDQMSNAELDELAQKRDRSLERAQHRLLNSGTPYVSLEDILRDPEGAQKVQIIKGIFAFGETSAWIGPPGSLKSALMASAAIAMAGGRDWFGHRNKCDNGAGVIYFALERADLVKRRLHAIAKRAGFYALPVAVVPGIMDLARPELVEKLLRTIRAIEKEFSQDFGLSASVLIFDTLAKLIAAGGGEENSAKDQGAIFANIQRIKNDLCGPHVALVGHTGKDESRGARGSNALLGDVDLMVTISGDTVKTATVTKANDAPEGPLFSFKSEIHEFGPDEDGDPITVNVVTSAEVAKQANSAEPKLTPNQRTVFAILHSAGGAGLTLEDWNTQAKDAGIGTKRKADLTDIRNALLSKRRIRTYGDRWYVSHD